MAVAGGKKEFASSSSVHLRRAAPRGAVAFAGDETGAVAASAARLRCTQGKAASSGTWWNCSACSVRARCKLQTEHTEIQGAATYQWEMKYQGLLPC